MKFLVILPQADEVQIITRAEGRINAMIFDAYDYINPFSTLKMNLTS